PAIMRWPGKVPAGKTSEAITSVLDIFPTLCAAAGITEKELLAMREPPANDRGIDLLPVVNGNLAGTDRPIFFEFHFPQRGVEPSLPLAVRKGKWKLFADHAFSAFQLYDLDRDIGEQQDVAGENEPVMRELKSHLQRWWAQFAGKVDLNAPRKNVPVPS